MTDFWYGGNPLAVIGLLSLGLALSTFVMGTLSGDYSWVDRLWSTAPIGYAWYYAWRGSLDYDGSMNALTLLAVAVSVWGARLTFNFARRGGYTGEEDYRWSILRKRITNKLAWHAFSLGFISLYQIGLFVLFTLPLYGVYELGMAGLLTGEFGLGLSGSLVLAFILLVYETISDQQQWDFHTLKQRVRSGENGPEIESHPWFDDAEAGFLRSGLFRFSRHPNYFGELGFWWSIFLGYGSLNVGFSWMILGPIMLTLLFIGSTVFTEGITASKYPKYREYQKTTSSIVPWIPGDAKVTKSEIA
ncbi:MAG: DUF1295 domain-containing protein [Spirochaetales bacterium]|nr:DUF1295 domain-containing protein [Spirochaetales bacterium]